MYTTDLAAFLSYKGSSILSSDLDHSLILHRIAELLAVSNTIVPTSTETKQDTIIVELSDINTNVLSSTNTLSLNLQSIISSVGTVNSSLTTVTNLLNSINTSISSLSSGDASAANQLNQTTILNNISTATTESNTNELSIISSLDSIVPLINDIDSTLTDIESNTGTVNNPVVTELENIKNNVIELVDADLGTKVQNILTSIGNDQNAVLQNIITILTTISNNTGVGGGVGGSGPLVGLNPADPPTNTFLDNVEDIREESMKISEIVCLLKGIKDCVCTRFIGTESCTTSNPSDPIMTTSTIVPQSNNNIYLQELVPEDLNVIESKLDTVANILYSLVTAVEALYSPPNPTQTNSIFTHSSTFSVDGTEVDSVMLIIYPVFSLSFTVTVGEIRFHPFNNQGNISGNSGQPRFANQTYDSPYTYPTPLGILLEILPGATIQYAVTSPNSTLPDYTLPYNFINV